MFPTKDTKEFFHKNNKELHFLAAHICSQFNVAYATEDIIQDVYVKLLTKDILKSFDPAGYGTKISTFIYHVIKNRVRSYVKSNNHKIHRNAVSIDSMETDSQREDFDFEHRYHTINPDQQSIIDRNAVSDNIDGLGFELRHFEDSYLSRRNKTHNLRRSKNKKNITGLSCTTRDIFHLLKEGHSNHDIAMMYGVSDMFVCLVKKDLAYELRRYGIEFTPDEEAACDTDQMPPLP